jgi:hypothetical protein
MDRKILENLCPESDIYFAMNNGDDRNTKKNEIFNVGLIRHAAVQQPFKGPYLVIHQLFQHIVF